MTTPSVLDIAIVGGGIAGITHLRAARLAGLSALLFEQGPAVGGLWRQLPAWQDIQIGLSDWNVGDLPLEGPCQPQVLANIEAWVSRFDLADGIRLASPVRQVRHDGEAWTLETPDGPVRARHLVAATGAHNRPLVPAVARRDSTVHECHSSALQDPRELQGRVALVVGGGASAFDLLDLCLAHGARRIVWVYRGLRWFVPSTKPKVLTGSVRPYARLQSSGLDIDRQSAWMDQDLQGRYEKYGLQAIRPARPLDLRRDQIIAGRPRMVAQFGEIERHPGEVAAIEGGEVLLADGTRLAVDTLLWGTGYGIDLSYFDHPQLAAVRSLEELGRRCACIFRSLDAPDLYFPGVGLDGNGSSPWYYMLVARTIASHVAGRARLDMLPLDHKPHHLDIVRHLSARDPGSYGDGQGWAEFLDMVQHTPDEQPYPFV